MTDRAIIFSAPMIHALLDGRKTMTRRILKPQPDPPPGFDGWAGFSCLCPTRHYEMRGYDEDLGPIIRHRPLRFWNGDRLWVRENFARVPVSAYRMSDEVQQTADPNDADTAAIYAAGWERSKPRWKPSIHMPRWASRLTLIVESVKVERLQEISYEDARAEGVVDYVGFCEATSVGHLNIAGETADDTARRLHWPQRAFSDLWRTINGADSWEANPWVAAISFRVVKANIDARCEEAAT
jgi:hypothetical protein